jgi:hypothetical protein
MKLRATVVAAALVPSLLLWAGTAVAIPGKSHDDEAKLSSKLEREKNPVKKAKLEVRLGRLKLEGAFSAYSKGQYKDCWRLLDAYQDFMDRAWADLQASGKIAAKKSDGFKQLDIGLRESRRDLEDFETHITYDERQAVEKIRVRTENLHNRVLIALFPAIAPKKNKQRPPGASPSDSRQEGNPQ